MNLQDILLGEDVVGSIKNNMDYLLKIIPEIKPMIDFDQKNPQHHLDVWEHTLLALKLSKNDFEIRLCLLLHDIGKPFSYQDEEVRRFRGHGNISEKMAEKILKRLNFNKDFISKICYLVKNHDNPITDDQIKKNYLLCLKLYEIQRCDALAHHPDKLEERKKYLSETKTKLSSLQENLNN